MPRTSIRRRLLTALIGFASLPLLVVGGVLGWRAYEQGMDEAYARKQEVARHVAVQVRALMGGFELALEDGLHLSDFAVAPLDDRRQVLARILAMRGVYREVALLDASGGKQIHLSNTRLLAPAEPVAPAFLDAFRAAAGSGRVAFGAVYYDPDNNEPLVALAAPVVEPRTGALAGVVVAEVRFRPIWRLIGGLALGEGEDVYLLDADGRVIAHRNPSIVLRETRHEPQAAQRRQVGLSGGDVFVAVEPFELGQRAYRVVAERDVQVVLRPAAQGLLITGAVVLVTLMGVFGLGLPLARRISRPIIAVSDAARAIRDGDLERRVAVEGADEIGDLARTFNAMTGRLRGTVQDLERLNRAYRALSLSNQAVARATEEALLLAEACRIVREDCGYRLVWIGLAEQDPACTVRPVAQAGFEEGYLATVNITWADSERGRGPTGTAIRERRAVVCQDMLSDPRFAPWRDQAVRRGYASSAAFPIQSEREVYGALMVYASEPRALAGEEVRLLSELAENIAFGIGRLRALAERERAEATLARTKALFQTVTQFANDWSYWRSDDRRIFHYCAPTCEAITGYPATEFEADPALLERILHPEDRQRWESHLQGADEVAPDSAHAPEEYRILTCNGEERWISHTCRPVVLADGTRLGLRGSNQDITERKRAEAELARHRSHLEELVTQRTAELRRQQRFVEAVLENVADGIVACDGEGRLSLFNRATREMHGIDLEGLPPDEWAGHYRLYRADGTTPMTTEEVPLFRAFQGEVVRGQEMVIEQRDGRKLTLIAAGCALRDEGGEKIGAVVTMHDVTEQTRAKAELERAKEVAERANRAKSVFLANMSHELRTPLNAILGFAQIMERDAAILAVHRHELETIHRAGTHLLSLINDVLEISRIESGGVTVQTEPFALEEALTAIEEMLRVRAEGRGLSLHFERHGPLPPYCLGDVHHLRQVLINLLGNAVKYTDAGEVVLHVYPEGGQMRFEVTDTGPGIPLQEQGRLFDAFYQTEVGIQKGEGAGLGLNISHQFVRLMGGDLWVVSEPGRGSTFGFTIPLPACNAPPEPHAATGRVVGIEPGQPAYRVLVAEDNVDSRELITRLLEAVGLEVRTAANGEEAVAAFEAWRPHLIWMDMRMPVLDGYQATQRIRALPGGREVHIAALTASAFREDREAILAVGCEEMVRKPVEEAQLFEVMGRLLGLRFRYEAPPPTRAVSREVDLTRLPGEVRAELGRAAETLDLEATQSIAERLRPEFPAEAGLIAALVEGYRFDRLVELCGVAEVG